MRWIKRFFLAVTAVTSLPLADLHFDPHALSGLSKYLPSVGLLLGVILAGLAYVLSTLLHASGLSCGILLTLTWLILSGGIHFDGLMDTADGIFSHRSPAQMLEIMRDSRVGNFGVMTGIGALLLKIGGLTHLTTQCANSTTMAPAAVSPQCQLMICAMLLLPTWSRWCEAFAIGRFHYLREQGLGKVWHQTTSFPKDVLLAILVPTLISIACAFHFGWSCTIVLSGATIVCGLVAAYYFKRVLNGHTGDTYGAVVELAEAGALTVAMLVHF